MRGPTCSRALPALTMSRKLRRPGIEPRLGIGDGLHLCDELVTVEDPHRMELLERESAFLAIRQRRLLQSFGPIRRSNIDGAGAVGRRRDRQERKHLAVTASVANIRTGPPLVGDLTPTTSLEVGRTAAPTRLAWGGQFAESRSRPARSVAASRS